jgi:AcrR family transcriptional regulator
VPPQTRALRPRRGTRPSNRRELILGAARDLFHQRGFDQIGVGDIAEAVAIGPSALYRHFSGKQQLLSDVLEREHVLLIDALDTAAVGDRDTFARSISRVALDFRGGSQLIQREARHLPEQDRERVREGSREIGRRMARMITPFRPDLDPDAIDLLAWAAIGVTGSPSVHRLDLPRERFEPLLARLVLTVLDSPVPSGFARSGGSDRTSLRPHSRRENLLAEAVRLFAEHGYTNVAVEDIGASLGISGPSVYNHVPSKLFLLRAPMTRGIATLLMSLTEAFDGATDPREVLSRLIRSYVRFAVAHHDLLQLLFSEVGHLPADLAEQFRRAQLEYLQEWGDLLMQTRPGLDVVEARITVQATVTMVNDIVRVRHLRDATAVGEALVGLCDRLLLDP